MAKVTFDGNNYLIIVNNGITSLDVKVDLYSDWKEWVVQGDNSKYYPAFRTVGGDPLSATVSLGDYYFLQNQVGSGWRIRPYESNHVLTITGNLVAEDPDYAMFVQTVSSYNVQIKLVTSSLTQTVNIAGGSSGSGITEDDMNLIATKVLESSTAGRPVGSLGYKASQITTASGLTGSQELMLLEMYRLLGLDPTRPLVVTTTTRTAGDIEQSISGDANTAITVQRI